MTDGRTDRKKRNTFTYLNGRLDRRTGHTDVTDGRTNGPDEQMDKNLVEEMILLIPTDEWTEQT